MGPTQAFLPDEERKLLAELDLLGITLPERHGGGGRPLLDALVVIEEVAKVCQIAAFTIFEASRGRPESSTCSAPRSRRRSSCRRSRAVR